MSIHPKKLWSNKRHITQQAKFYNTTDLGETTRDGGVVKSIEKPLPEPVTEIKLPGEIQIDAAGRVIMPGEPQGPSRIER